MLECKLDAPPQLARYIILAVQSRSNLKPQHGAVERQRFYSKHARPIHQRRRVKLALEQAHILVGNTHRVELISGAAAAGG